MPKEPGTTKSPFQNAGLFWRYPMWATVDVKELPKEVPVDAEVILVLN